MWDYVLTGLIGYRVNNVLMDFHIVFFAQFEIVLLFEVILIIVQIIAAGFGTALQLGLENLFDNKELIALFGGAGIDTLAHSLLARTF